MVLLMKALVMDVMVVEPFIMAAPVGSYTWIR